METINAIETRHSVRQFLDTAVPKEMVIKILEAAKFSPSGANLQPWKVAVVMGDTQRRLSNAIVEAAGKSNPHPKEQYYPPEWFEPYKSRRYETGMALYKALEIKRDDKERRLTQWNKNYHFFDAPVGLLFFIDERMGQGAWIDLGIFAQSIMLAAVDLGLGSCAQASIADYPDVVSDCLDLPDNLILAFGMSLGFEDTDTPVNQYRVKREDSNNFTFWFE